MVYTILLYYKYIHIEDPEALRGEQRALCERLGLKGRIIISQEGINGTLEGQTENTDEYIQQMQQDVRFADVDFKKSEGNGQAFPKLSIKARTEIVTLGTGTADLTQDFKKGTYISPDDLQQWFDRQEDFVILDMRNDYEHAVGHFEGSVRLPVKSFKEIPEALKSVEETIKHKKVVSVCTGGVRCEKATSHLLERGFNEVYQLEGGMVRYLEKHHGKKFKGSLYVFDRRILVSYDTPDEHKIVGTCHHCTAPTELYVNCQNKMCNCHFLCCEACAQGDDGSFCTEECKMKVQAVSSVV